MFTSPRWRPLFVDFFPFNPQTVIYSTYTKIVQYIKLTSNSYGRETSSLQETKWIMKQCQYYKKSKQSKNGIINKKINKFILKKILLVIVLRGALFSLQYFYTLRPSIKTKITNKQKKKLLKLVHFPQWQPVHLYWCCSAGTHTLKSFRASILALLVHKTYAV